MATPIFASEPFRFLSINYNIFSSFKLHPFGRETYTAIWHNREPYYDYSLDDDLPFSQNLLAPFIFVSSSLTGKRPKYNL